MERSFATEPAPAPRCYRHRERETWVSCTRCDRPICPDCLRPAAVGFQCPHCVAEGNAAARQPKTQYGGAVLERTGLVTVVLGFLNIAAYFVTAVTSVRGFSHNSASQLFSRLVLVPIRVAQNDEYYRLIGSAFLHIGSLHLIVNMLSLAVVGPALERVFGHWRFLTVYLAGALGGAVAVYLFDSPYSAVAGASGAIYGLFAATVIVLRNLGLDARFMVVTIGINVAVSFSPGISWLGHVGGLVAGGLAAAAVVYAPKGTMRTSFQILALGGVFATILLLVLIRSNQLLSLAG